LWLQPFKHFKKVFFKTLQLLPKHQCLLLIDSRYFLIGLDSQLNFLNLLTYPCQDTLLLVN
jgi:hypothetical protein